MTTPQVSVIIPVYNEEGNVGQLQQELHGALAGSFYEILFVDDGSRDKTLEKIGRGPGVRVIEFSKNSGQSAAIYAGLFAAHGQILVLIDGDLQNDPRDIPRLLAEIEKGADLVCGYRTNRKDTWFKRVQSQIANTVRSRFTHDGVRDTGCTLKAMKRECREALIPFHGVHRFIPALIKGQGYRIVEIPVNHRPRRHGVSKYTFANRALQATIDMLGVRWLLSRQLRIKVKSQ
ncbi:MAG: glycosyltransferase family 2 protein [Verrucomicrobia bacterium]|nr:glycosyltransferase family 2 protein [Verrucomicrobiota bacterium]